MGNNDFSKSINNWINDAKRKLNIISDLDGKVLTDDDVDKLEKQGIPMREILEEAEVEIPIEKKIEDNNNGK
jgi:hypothetical protein